MSWLRCLDSECGRRQSHVHASRELVLALTSSSAAAKPTAASSRRGALDLTSRATTNPFALTRLQLHLFPQRALPTHSTSLTLYYYTNNITTSQHRTIPESSFACTISTFIHTPCTPPSLNLCTLHCLHPLQSEPSTNHHHYTFA